MASSGLFDRFRAVVVGFGLCVALIACCGSAGAAGNSAATGRPCGGGVLCERVVVPLDWSHTVKGSVSLYAQVLPAAGKARGVMFLIAGGPGQASTSVFGLNKGAGRLYQAVFPGYTLVSFDPRGSGQSSPLRCPSASVEACVKHLGAARNLYSTSANAQDIDAVRAQLGADKIALWGTSYGTKLALAYAQAHGSHVERLLLDSVLAPSGPGLFNAETLRAVAPNLSRYCSVHGCSNTIPHVGPQTIALANALAAHPLRGTIPEPAGKTRHVTVSADDLLELVIDSDLNPALAAELPAAIHAARTGSPTPLLRIADLVNGGASDASLDLSDTLLLATSCADARLPWNTATTLDQRVTRLATTATRRLSPSTRGGFGTWAEFSGTGASCLPWPSPTSDSISNSTSYPNVPVLALSGSFDMRTPTAEARYILRQFPHGHLLIVPGSGHAVLSSALSPCLIKAVHRWLDNQTPSRQCSNPLRLQALTAYPNQTAPAHRYSPDRTITIAGKTLDEAETTWLLETLNGSSLRVITGLDGGTLRSRKRTIQLNGYSISPGLTLTATLHAAASHGKLTFTGPVTIGGKNAAGGTLTLSDTNLRGKLNDHNVTANRIPTTLGDPNSNADIPAPSSLAHA